MKAAAEMTVGEVLSNRKWGASLTVEQMRGQIAWEQACERRGTLAPWPGAEWNGYIWTGGNPSEKWPD